VLVYLVAEELVEAHEQQQEGKRKNAAPAATRFPDLNALRKRGGASLVRRACAGMRGRRGACAKPSEEARAAPQPLVPYI
jgi:hypothetical protein